MAHAYSQIAVWLDADDRVKRQDLPHPDLPLRVITFAWGPLTVHLPSASDADVVVALDNLICAASELRDAAQARALAKAMA